MCKTPLLLPLFASCVLAGLVFVAAPHSKATAQSRLVQPNYARYCNTYYRLSFVNRLRATNEPICTRRIGPYAMYHYRIRIGEACRLTTGNRLFRRIGPGIYRCVVRFVRRPAPRANIPRTGRAPNYRVFCARYYPGTVFTRQRVTREPYCTRFMGRYQRYHYRINVRAACRLTTGSTRVIRVASGIYRCL
jgi:hypothetical protein